MPEIKVKVTSEGVEKVNREVDFLDRAVDDGRKSVDRYVKSFLTIGAAVGVVLAVRRAVDALVSSQRVNIDLAAQQEAETVRLNAALRTSGQFSREYSEELLANASALQAVTTFGDEAILGLQRQLISFGATKDNIQATTEAALDLSAGLGTDLTASALLLGKALSGDFGTLSRYGILVDKNLSSSEKFEAALDQISKKFGGQAAAAARSYQGRVVQLGNAWGDAREKLGDFVVQSDAVNDSIRITTNFIVDLGTKLELWREEADGVEVVMRKLIIVTADFAVLSAEAAKILGAIPVAIAAGPTAAANFVESLGVAADTLRDLRSEFSRSFQFRDFVDGLDSTEDAIRRRIASIDELKERLDEINRPRREQSPDLRQGIDLQRQGGGVVEVGGLPVAADEVTRRTRALREELEILFDRADDLGQIPADLKGMAREFGFGNAAVAKLNDTLDETKTKLGAVGFEFIENQIDANVRAVERYRKATLEAVDAQVALIEEAQGMVRSVRPYRALAEEIERINEMAAALPGIIDDAARTDLIRQAARDMGDFGNEAENALSGVQNALDAVGEQFEDTFVDALTGQKTSVKDFVDAVISDLARIGVQEFVTKPIFGGIVESIRTSQEEGEVDRRIERASDAAVRESASQVEGHWSDAADSVGDKFTGMIDGVGSVARTMVTGVGGLFTSILIGLFGGGGGGFSAGGFFKAFGFGAASGALGAAGNALGGVLGDAIKNVGNTVSTVGQGTVFAPETGPGSGTVFAPEHSPLPILDQVAQSNFNGGFVPQPQLRVPTAAATREQSAASQTIINIPTEIHVARLNPQDERSAILQQMPMIERSIMRSIERGGDMAVAVRRRKA